MRRNTFIVLPSSSLLSSSSLSSLSFSTVQCVVTVAKNLATIVVVLLAVGGGGVLHHPNDHVGGVVEGWTPTTTVTTTTTTTITALLRKRRALHWVTAPAITSSKEERSISILSRSSSSSRSSSRSSSSRSSPFTTTTTTLSAAATTTASSTVKLPDTSQPISPHTFGGMVEQRLLEKYNNDDSDNNIDRIITSWRLLDKEYYHKQYVGDNDDDDNNNNSTDYNNDNDEEDPIIRPSMVQECHSYVPGLTIRPFWDEPTSQFQWAQYLQSHYKDIKQEFLDVTSNMDRLTQEGNNIWAGALTDDATSYGIGWKTLVLMDRGRWDTTNTRLFPKTATAIYKSGIPATEVFFASMEPHSTIKVHSDFTNFVLTSHLPLVVPYSGQNKCRLTIGNTTREWMDGQLMVFDTSLLHDAVNESDQTRYILMMRLWHPDLTDVERQALQYTYDALEVDGLVSPDPTERYAAEQIVNAVRSFPLPLDDDRTDSGRGGDGSRSSNTKKGQKKSKSKKTTSNTKSKPAKGFGRK